MTYLKIAITFAVFVVACNAVCKHNKLDLKNPKKHPTGCWYQGTKRSFNSHWLSKDCDNCTCKRSGVVCCDHDKVVTGFNPKKCAAFFMEDTCTFKVVLKEDHRVVCSHETVEFDSEEGDHTYNSNSEEWQKWDREDYSHYIQYISSSHSTESKSEEEKKPHDYDD